MRSYLRAAAALPLILAAPAFAQDMAAPADPAVQPAPPPPAQDYGAPASLDDTPFNGLYVGGSVGYEVQPNDVGSSVLFDRNLDGRFGDTVTTAAGANAFSPGFCNGAARAATLAGGRGCRNDKDGLGYSARIGFDQHIGPVVAGVVGEFGKSEIRDSVSGFSTTPANYVLTREVEWEASIRGRLGYAANTTLFYGTGGAGYLSVDNSFSSTNTANAYTTNGNDKVWGGVFGGGVEQKIGRNFSVGLEYLYHDYNDDGYRVRASRGTAPATNPFVLAPNTTGTDFARSDNRFRWHSLRATANFRF